VSAARRLGDLAFITVTQVLGKLRGFVIIPLMLRAFGAAEYGAWVQLILATSLICGFSQANLHLALARYLPGAPDEERPVIFWTGFWWVLLGSLAAGAALLTAAAHLGAALGVSALSIQLLAGLVIVRGLWQYVISYWRAHDRPRLYSTLESVPLLSELFAVIVAAIVGGSLSGMLLWMTGIEGVALACCVVSIAGSIRVRAPARTTARRMLSYALPLIPMNVCTFVMAWGDRYAIGTMLGAAEVGIYSAAYAVCSIPLFFVRPLSVQLLPRAAKLWDGGDRPAAGRLLRRSVKIYLLLSIPSTVGLTVLGPAVLARLGGAPNPAWTYPLMLSIGLGTTLFGLIWLGLHVLHLEEKTSAGVSLYLIGATVNLALNFVLLPRIGLVAAGIATAVAYGAVCVPIYLRARKVMGGMLEAGVILRIGLGSAVMAGVLIAINPSSPAPIALSVLLGAAVFGLASHLLGVFTREEIDLLKSLYAGARRRLKAL
jgi:O-antigen/teichoic acid export membrane protein